VFIEYVDFYFHRIDLAFVFQEIQLVIPYTFIITHNYL